MKYFFTLVFISLSCILCRAQSNNHLFDQAEWQFNPPAIPNDLRNLPTWFVPELAPAADIDLPSTSTGKEPAFNEEAGIRGYTSVNIGYTLFDLQTNASVCNNFFRNDDGNMYAVWNFVPVIDPNLTQRGTGYNFFKNGTWQPEPAVRLEGTKNGWPNVIISSDSIELILSHNLELGGIQKTHRAPPSSGLWVEQLNPFPPPNLYGVWWPRIVADTSSDYVHAIALTLPTLQGGVHYQGIDGALLYYRSKDKGITWDKTNELISSIDLTQYARIRPDNYSIDVFQNNIAIVAGGFGNDIVLLRSGDNGLNWTKTIVQDFPILLFDDQITDVNNDGVADWIDTNDGSLAVLFDKSGFVHVWAGYNQIYNSDSTDHTFAFNSTANGILYWNSTMGAEPMKMIAGAIDLDGTDSLEVSQFGFYNTGWASHPSAGIDELGRIYITYSALAETGIDLDGKTVRHTYITGSGDGGDTWSYPYDVVNEQNAEGIYGSIARFNDGNVRLIYQKDSCAGISTTPGFPDPCNSGRISRIVYVEAPANEVITSSELIQNHVSTAGKAYPNPADDFLILELPLSLPEEGTIEITDMSGSIIDRMETRLSPQQQVRLDHLPPGIYLLHVRSSSHTAFFKIEVLR